MKTNVFVGNLPYSVTSEELEDLFSQAGTVVGAKVITDRYTNRSRGFGFVEFETQEEAKKAIEEFNGYSLHNRNLVVSEARNSEGRRNRNNNYSHRDRY